MSFWDENEGKWCLEKGMYKVIVAMSSLLDGQEVASEVKIGETVWWEGL